MMTQIVLLMIGIVGVSFALLPVWQGVRRPWAMNVPSGEEEALGQEQVAALDALRDLAVDYKLGNLAESDYRALAAPLQLRTRRAIQLQGALKKNLRPGAESSAGTAASSVEDDARLEAQIRNLRRVFAHTESSSTEIVRFCPQCGSPVASGFRFCSACGAKLPTVRGEQTQAENGSAQPEDADTTNIQSPLVAVAVSASTSVSQEATQEVIPPTDVGARVVQSPDDGRVGVDSSASRHNAIAGLDRRRRLWIFASVVSVLWVVAIIWFYLSSRAGLNAQTPIATLPGVRIQSLAVTDGLLVMGESKGIRTSQDGQEWMPLPVTGDVRAVTRIDKAGGAFWLATGPEGLWRSEDGALVWRKLDVAPEEARFSTITAADGQSELIWAAEGAVLHFSQDEGQSWMAVKSQLPGEPRALAAGAMDLFVGTNQGVFRNVGGGDDAWQNYNGSVNGKILSTDIRALAYDEKNGMLYAGTPRGLSFQKLNAPGSWGQRSLQADVTALALDGADNQVLWAGTSDGKIYRSNDRGVTWK